MEPKIEKEEKGNRYAVWQNQFNPMYSSNITLNLLRGVKQAVNLNDHSWSPPRVYAFPFLVLRVQSHVRRRAFPFHGVSSYRPIKVMPLSRSPLLLLQWCFLLKHRLNILPIRLTSEWSTVGLTCIFLLFSPIHDRIGAPKQELSVMRAVPESYRPVDLTINLSLVSIKCESVALIASALIINDAEQDSRQRKYPDLRSTRRWNSKLPEMNNYCTNLSPYKRSEDSRLERWSWMTSHFHCQQDPRKSTPKIPLNQYEMCNGDTLVIYTGRTIVRLGKRPSERNEILGLTRSKSTVPWWFDWRTR